MQDHRAVGEWDAATQREDDILALPVVSCAGDELAAMAVVPRIAPGSADHEWALLDRAILALDARDWPAVIVPISMASLRAPSFAYRVRDLLERNQVEGARLWLEIDTTETALDWSGVVASLALRHAVGCRTDGADAFGERALLPELAACGISFIWLDAGEAQSVADDLSALIAGRSLVRRARAHDIAVIASDDLAPDFTPPPPP